MQHHLILVAITSLGLIDALVACTKTFHIVQPFPDRFGYIQEVGGARQSFQPEEIWNHTLLIGENCNITVEKGPYYGIADIKINQIRNPYGSTVRITKVVDTKRTELLNSSNITESPENIVVPKYGNDSNFLEITVSRAAQAPQPIPTKTLEPRRTFQITKPGIYALIQDTANNGWIGDRQAEFGVYNLVIDKNKSPSLVYVEYFGLNQVHLRKLLNPFKFRVMMTWQEGNQTKTIDTTAPDYSIDDWYVPGSSLGLIKLTIEDAPQAAALTTAPAEPTVSAPAGSLTARPEVQDLPFNEVTFLGTHNSTSYIPGLINVTDQNRNVEQQLLDGVRVFSIRAHDFKHDNILEAHVCHGNMAVRIGGALGEGRACDVDPSHISLTEFLRIIGNFLVAHPTEIVTLHISDFTHENHERSTPDLLVKAFQDAGVQRFVFKPENPYAPWPTIKELIKQDKRLIVFHSDNNQDSADATWLLPKWAYVIDSYGGQPTAEELMKDYTIYSPSTTPSPAYSNRLDPKTHRTLLKVNHHVTPGITGSKSIATQVNTYDKVMERLKAWQKIYGIPPHALIVDFYDLPSAPQLLKAVTDLTLENARTKKPWQT